MGAKKTRASVGGSGNTLMELAFMSMSLFLRVLRYINTIINTCQYAFYSWMIRLSVASRRRGVKGGSNSLAKAVGGIIYEKRKALGLTQAVLAEKLGIGQQSLSRIEQGRMAPKFERLQDIAEALECGVADLFRNVDVRGARYAESIADILVTLTEEERIFTVEQTVRLARFIKKNRG
jgi:transcriptional regulator with XRE-family HTH domain